MPNSLPPPLRLRAPDSFHTVDIRKHKENRSANPEINSIGDTALTRSLFLESQFRRDDDTIIFVTLCARSVYVVSGIDEI